MNKHLIKDLNRYADLLAEGELVSPDDLNCSAIMRLAAEALRRKPLTDEQIAYATAPVFMGGNPSLTGIARAIEAAHGIKGDA